jgi:hypothetical protein
MVTSSADLAPAPARSRYGATLRRLNQERIPYLVGGTYALSHYTGIFRPTKDLDLFVREADRDGLLDALERLGWRTRIAFPHWLSKARQGDDAIDVIHGSGNGLASVDHAWFEHARHARLEALGADARLVPPEEMIFSKAFVMEKYRFDGADVAHLLLRQGRELDWARLRRRFGARWRVLFAHLVLFRFVYPDSDAVPRRLFRDLARRAAQDKGADDESSALCRGVLLSRKQYAVDTQRWGFEDARRAADVAMTRRDIATWTAAPVAPPGPDADS